MPRWLGERQDAAERVLMGRGRGVLSSRARADECCRTPTLGTMFAHSRTSPRSCRGAALFRAPLMAQMVANSGLTAIRARLPKAAGSPASAVAAQGRINYFEG